MRLSKVVLFTIFSIFCVRGDITMPNQKPVQSIINEAVTIPCTFKRTPVKPITNATVLWWKTRAYEGPLLYQCERKGASNGNCSKSVGRFSFAGNLTQKNLSLRVSHVTPLDAGVYICRIMLENKIDWYTHPEGVVLSVKVPQRLERIYLQTTVTGEHWVTCEVSGHPLPEVTWVQPEDISNLSVFNNTSFLRASFSLSVAPNTNYTCQIAVQNRTEKRSISSMVSVHPVCGKCLIVDKALIGGLAALVAATFVVVVLVIWYCCSKREISKESQQNDNVYYNYTNKPDIEDIYMNDRKH